VIFLKREPNVNNVTYWRARAILAKLECAVGSLSSRLKITLYNPDKEIVLNKYIRKDVGSQTPVENPKDYTSNIINKWQV
jgi:hypothetical protein